MYPQISSENCPPSASSSLLVELAETCRKVGKNIGGTNQSLSESLVAQTIILDEETRSIHQQQLELNQKAQLKSNSIQAIVSGIPKNCYSGHHISKSQVL